MTEILRADYYPGAQPVRCANGWLLATHPECTVDQATLLIDAAATDAAEAWHQQPDGTHRLLLMAASPKAQFVTIAVANRQPVAVRINGTLCQLNVIEVKRIVVDGYQGLSYSVLVSHADMAP